MKTKVFPIFVGWYAIASILDAMFYSISGLAFFVGQEPVLRVLLTVFDSLAFLVTYGYMNWEWFGGEERKVWRFYATRLVKDYYDRAIKEKIEYDRKKGRGYFYSDGY